MAVPRSRQYQRWPVLAAGFRPFFLLGAVYAGVAILMWLPTLFARRFGWPSGQIGVAIGSVILICATLGILASMSLAARLQRKQLPDALPRTSLLLAWGLVPSGIALPLMSNPVWSLILLAPVMALSFGLLAMVFPIL